MCLSLQVGSDSWWCSVSDTPTRSDTTADAGAGPGGCPGVRGAIAATAPASATESPAVPLPYRIVNHGLCATCGDDDATDDPRDACCGYGFYEPGGHTLSEAQGQGRAVKVPLLARDTHIGCELQGKGGLLLGPCTCGPGEACVRPCEVCHDMVEHERLAVRLVTCDWCHCRVDAKTAVPFGIGGEACPPCSAMLHDETFGRCPSVCVAGIRCERPAGHGGALERLDPYCRAGDGTWYDETVQPGYLPPPSITHAGRTERWDG